MGEPCVSPYLLISSRSVYMEKQRRGVEILKESKNGFNDFSFLDLFLVFMGGPLLIMPQPSRHSHQPTTARGPGDRGRDHAAITRPARLARAPSSTMMTGRRALWLSQLALALARRARDRPWMRVGGGQLKSSHFVLACSRQSMATLSRSRCHRADGLSARRSPRQAARQAAIARTLPATLRPRARLGALERQ